MKHEANGYYKLQVELWEQLFRSTPPLDNLRLHDIPLISLHFCMIKNTLIRTLFRYINVTPSGKELNIREFFME